jgi:hypothetical protein
MRIEAIAAIARGRHCRLFVWFDPSPGATVPWLIGLGDHMGNGADPVQALGAALSRADGQWAPPTDPSAIVHDDGLRWLTW